jgi:hypothetical protein
MMEAASVARLLGINIDDDQELISKFTLSLGFYIRKYLFDASRR